MIDVAPHAGHYIAIVGMANNSGVGGPADYPPWVRLFIIITVVTTWMGLNITSAVIGRNLVPTPMHYAVILLVASLFRVEFGSIRLEKKDKDQ